MSIFSSIMNKIFRRAEPAKAEAPAPAAGAAPAAPPPPSPAAPAATTPPASVDVGAVLSEMAAMQNGGGNYKTSIVDLLKLLDLDSSLDARRELAGELDVRAGADGSAEQNIALHKAVMAKLAANGGIVPDELRS